MENQDWTGNSKSVYGTMGASNHSVEERQGQDYYATDPRALELLLDVESFDGRIWECACGGGHLSEVLKKRGFDVRSTDLMDRGYGEILDFLGYKDKWDGNIITNPPYRHATDFVRHAMDVIPEGRKVAMFLKIQFLEGKARKKMFALYPPVRVWVSSSRFLCAKNGIWGKGPGFISGSVICYAWFVWEKGFKGDTIVKWFN